MVIAVDSTHECVEEGAPRGEGEGCKIVLWVGILKGLRIHCDTSINTHTPAHPNSPTFYVQADVSVIHLRLNAKRDLVKESDIALIHSESHVITREV